MGKKYKAMRRAGEVWLPKQQALKVEEIINDFFGGNRNACVRAIVLDWLRKTPVIPFKSNTKHEGRVPCNKETL